MYCIFLIVCIIVYGFIPYIDIERTKKKLINEIQVLGKYQLSIMHQNSAHLGSVNKSWRLDQLSPRLFIYLY